MRPDTVLQSDLLDILFEHRNKDYGAYTLRKEYNHRLMLAVTGMFSIVVFFFAWFYFNNNKNNKPASALALTDDSVVIRIYDIPKDPPLPPPPAVKPQPKVATIKVVTPVIVPDHVISDPPPPVDQLDNDDALISNVTSDGEKPTSVSTSPTTPPGGNGAGPVQPVSIPEPEETIKHYAEKMPEFPGGTQALIRFLSKHLRVPDEKQQPGDRVRVPVKFVVDGEGQLTDIQFPETADEEYKNEIRRVMKKMPKWIPGMQHGKPVSVYFSIPIIFEVTDQ